MKQLLDTTVVSDFTRGHSAVLDRLKRTARSQVAISTVTVMEVEYGLQLNSARARRIEPMIRALLEDLIILPYEREDALTTAAIRAALSRRGVPIGPYDVMLAGTALRRGLILVTSNTGEFERVQGLVLDDWRWQAKTDPP